MVGKVSGKAFRMLGLGERKGRWVVKQDFRGNFRVNVTWFFAFSPVSLTESCSFSVVWFERSLYPAQVSGQSCPE